MRLCETRWLTAAPVMAAFLWACELAPGPAGHADPAPPVPEERLAQAEARERGRAIYRDKCVLCHGENADGRGVRRWSLSPPPRDYSDPTWRKSASPTSVYLAIRDGVANTAMPSWDSFTNDQIWDLVAYVMSVAEQGP